MVKTIGQAGAEAVLKAMDEVDSIRALQAQGFYQPYMGVPALMRRVVVAALRSLSEQAYEREDALVVDMSDIYDIADELERLP